MAGRTKLIAFGGVLFAGMLAGTDAGNDDERIGVPSLPPARERVSVIQGCVEPTEIMRKNHMRFLFHQRDQTVHAGVRTKRHSLIGCIDCHATTGEDGRALAIDAPGQFCESCHTYAAVRMDCFGCHAATPAANGLTHRPLPKAQQTAALLVDARR